MSAVKFRVGTYSEYLALASVDSDALYFITDAKKIFKGETEVTENIVPVTSNFPTYQNAFEGKLYVDPTTLEVKIKVAGESALTTLVPGYISSGEDAVAANNSKIATVEALIGYVGTYVAAQFGSKTTLGEYGITDAKIENGTITLGSNTITPIPTSQKGAANGVAELDANGKVPSAQLPSYVDDVIEGYYYNGKFYAENYHTTEITAESGKIYVNIDDDKTYRWSGSQYVVISETLALGETSSTAYRGDRGKTAYDHSQLTSGNPHNVSKSDLGLDNVTNHRQVQAANSSTSGDIVIFSGQDGDEVSDSGKTIIDSGNMGNSSDQIPTANLIDTAISSAVSAATSDLVTRSELSAVGSDVSDLTTRMDTAESDIDALETTTSGLGKRLDTAESDIDTLETTTGGLDTRLSTAESNITILGTTAAGHESRLTAAEGDIHTLDSSVSALGTQLSTAENDIDALESTTSGLNTRLSTAEGNITNHDSSISKLTTVTTGLDTRLTAAENDIDSLESAVQTIETDLDSAETNISTLQSDVSAIDTRLTSAESDISALQAAVTWESI